MSSNIDQYILPNSRIPCCYTFPSPFWASECLILCKSSLEESSTTPPLDPFVALGLFLTHQAASIINLPFAEDQTIKRLYNLAMEHYQSNAGSQLHLIDALKQVFDAQDREYERILELVNSNASFDTLIQAIGHAQARNKSLKRKYIEIDGNNDSNDNFETQSTTSLSHQKKYGIRRKVQASKN